MLAHLVRLFILWHHKTMKSIDDTKKPKKGRPAVDTEAVNLRLPREMLDAIEEYRREQDDIPTRQEAIRHMLQGWLMSNGYVSK